MRRYGGTGSTAINSEIPASSAYGGYSNFSSGSGGSCGSGGGIIGVQASNSLNIHGNVESNGNAASSRICEEGGGGAGGN